MGDGYYSNGKYKKIIQFPKASATVGLFDAVLKLTYPISGVNYVGAWNANVGTKTRGDHSGRANYMMLDMHVESGPKDKYHDWTVPANATAMPTPF
jgi:prepilin-type processing-associated H-X9-DG protein